MTLGWWSWLTPSGVVGSASVREVSKWWRSPSHNLMSDMGCRRGWDCRSAPRSSRRNHCKSQARSLYAAEGFLADFVSTPVNDYRRGDIETGRLVPYIPASAQTRSKHSKRGRDTTEFYSKSYLAWLTCVGLPMSFLSSYNPLSES